MTSFTVLLNTSSVSISKYSFYFIFVPKCNIFFKLLDAFIILFLHISLINTISFVLKYKKSHLIHMQTNDNIIILTHKTYTLMTLTTF